MAITGLKDSLVDHKLPQNAQENLEALDPMVEDLKKSVDRIVGYSRLISDMSAGRGLRPNFTLGSMADTIQRGAAYLESESRSKHVALLYDIDFNAPDCLFDDLFVFRIVQNLVGNSVKAVYETIPDEEIENAEQDTAFGSVTVIYRFEGENHIFEVVDTGPGMTPDVSRRILTGNARSQWSKAGGSGWGTKIVLELAASHGGKVEIDSKVGVGTTFRVLFPHRKFEESGE
jgi:signal transduction histidine kinase